MPDETPEADPLPDGSVPLTAGPTEVLEADGTLASEFYAGEDPAARVARNRSARAVTLGGAFLNLVLSVVKLVVGVVANSAALVADGVHSLSDLIGDGIVWLAYVLGGKEADDDHHYGHQRYQTVAAVVVALLIAATAIGIMWEAIDRLDQSDFVTPGWLALVVAAVSIVVKEGLFRWQYAVGTRLNDQLLKGNAVHHRSDAMSSVAALIGIGGAMAGAAALDLVAAVVVGLLLLRAGWGIWREALSEITEGAADPEVEARIRAVIAAQPDVDEVHLLMTRRLGSEVFVDVHVQVPPRISVTAGHQVAERVRRAVIEQVSEATEVLVHVDPEDDEEGSALYPPRGDLVTHVEAALATVPGATAWEEPGFHLLNAGVEVVLIVTPAPELGLEEMRALVAAVEQALVDEGTFAAAHVSLRWPDA